MLKIVNLNVIAVFLFFLKIYLLHFVFVLKHIQSGDHCTLLNYIHYNNDKLIL